MSSIFDDPAFNQKGGKERLTWYFLHSFHSSFKFGFYLTENHPRENH